MVPKFDLESARDRGRLVDPELALEDLRGLIVLDEVQLRPELFPSLRVLVDRTPRRSRFLILGSATPELLQQSSESLAGRITYYTLPGLSLEEVGAERLNDLWLRGDFPRSFLARSHRESRRWRDSFVDTFLARDLPDTRGRAIAASPVTIVACLRDWIGRWIGSPRRPLQASRWRGVARSGWVRYGSSIGSKRMHRS